jgi:hypothetical protein
MPRSLHRRSVLLCSLLLVTSSGCRALIDLIDGDSVSTVRVFATHAGTPDEDGFPHYGDSDTTRVFHNDMDWQLSLSEIYVTTTEVRLVRCSASTGTEIEMFWGACPEDFVRTNDGESIALGGVTISDGEFCRLDVTFAPYIPEDCSSEQPSLDNPMIEGNTILITGIARRGTAPDLEEIPFQLVSDATITARIDLSTFENGGPLTLDKENVARDLLILKTYDTFFNGVDFATASAVDIEAAVLAGLELDTRVYSGSKI